MIVEELYKDIMNVVCETTGVSESDILHNNREECADARYLLVFFLFESGMYPSQIAAHIHKTKRAVNYMISNFHERMESGKMMRIYWDDIKNLLGNN